MMTFGVGVGTQSVGLKRDGDSASSKTLIMEFGGAARL